MTYDEFIDNILQTRGQFGCGDEYHERHHIIPKCIGGTNDQNNLIDLYAKEHFEAHRLLALEHPDNQSLTYAWWCMSVHTNQYTNERYKLTAEEYEEVRKKMSDMLTGRKLSEETRKKLLAKLIGRKHTTATKQKISESHKGIRPSLETRIKMSNIRQGKFVAENNPFYGKRHTEETRKKISESLKGKEAGARNPNAKIVCQFDSNMKCVNVWNFVRQASEILNINKDSISMCATGQRKHAGDYYWRYLYDMSKRDGTIVDGAITLCLVTEQDALNTLDNTKLIWYNMVNGGGES